MIAEMPPIESRVLDMDHMRDLLREIHRRHTHGLHRDVASHLAWRRIRPGTEFKALQHHIDAAINAGFLDEISHTGNQARRVRLTPKGRAAIGASAPIWMEDAA